VSHAGSCHGMTLPDEYITKLQFQTKCNMFYLVCHGVALLQKYKFESCENFKNISAKWMLIENDFLN
jgi:hypothetical protein